MSEQRPARVYYPGDEVRIRLTFKHHTTPIEVEVVFVHAEDESQTLTLTGNPELMDDSPAAGEEKHSVVVVSEVVDVKHIPGRYSVARAVFYTYSGATRGIGTVGWLASPFLAAFALGTQGAATLAPHDWPVIEVRPESRYVEITGVELDEAD